MLVIVLGLVLNSVVLCQATAQTRSDRDWDHLVGLVRIVVQENAKIKNASGQYVEVARSHWRTTTYDLQGKMIKEEPPSPMGGAVAADAQERRIDRIYQAGQIVEERSYRSDGSLRSKHVWKHDSQGRQIEWLIYRASEDTGELILDGKWTYTHDDRGNVTE